MKKARKKKGAIKGIASGAEGVAEATEIASDVVEIETALVEGVEDAEAVIFAEAEAVVVDLAMGVVVEAEVDLGAVEEAEGALEIEGVAADLAIGEVVADLAIEEVAEVLATGEAAGASGNRSIMTGEVVVEAASGVDVEVLTTASTSLPKTRRLNSTTRLVNFTLYIQIFQFAFLFW